jgi:hypothetical protein
VFCATDRATLSRAAGVRGLESVLLPDPGHALWGLLDHHPKRRGRLELPEGGLGTRLPQGRLAALAAAQALAPLGGARALVPMLRRRLIESARRALLAGHEVATDGRGESLLAALIGRSTLPSGPGAARLAAYWRLWDGEAAT